ncbi:MAG TPA: PLD nuclease N-terminal domain-containing protein [Humisphaera sp.]|jgi:sterol desaturase/sphingolipid hydroxylase (fatty acid hydroxylase superfamily)|nr:PLD nuclease N-terminal domain-containing protein [Humisphaera sp.]
MQPIYQLIAQSSAAHWFTTLDAILLVLALIGSIFWIWALVDCLSSPMPTGEKVMWFFVIVFLHFIGALVYVAVARVPHQPPTARPQ